MVFEVVQSKVVFTGKIFNVEQHQVTLPEGRLANVDVVKLGDAITILPLDQDGFIWFIRQYRHPAQRWLLELPAGHLEKGEAPEDGAAREIREEIGMAAEKITRLGGFFLAPGYSTEYLHCYLATGLSPDPLEQDEDEVIEIARMTVSEAFQLAEKGSPIHQNPTLETLAQEASENASRHPGVIEDAKTIATLLLARQHLIRSV
jgi:ADP-ribose pyrophosphatase